jgi:hypothetical protein
VIRLKVKEIKRSGCDVIFYSVNRPNAFTADMRLRVKALFLKSYQAIRALHDEGDAARAVALIFDKGTSQ